MVLQDLGRRINAAVSDLTRSTNLDEKALDSMLKEICDALVSADVNVRRVSDMRKSIKRTVNFANLPPNTNANNKKRLIQQAVFDHLVALVDPHAEPYKPKKGRSNVIMMVGLQGAGKTTSCTKLARHYAQRGFKACLVCADTFRAGAYDQLKQNATKAKIPYYGSLTQTDPAVVAAEGVARFKKEKFEIIIVDTSGRHEQEKDLFAEMEHIQAAIKPDQTIMVLDGTIGQQAEPQSAAFKATADFGAIIITKTDGGAAGGGAISAVAATHTPIIFLGTGEHLLDLERFAPKPFISKLLGYGDMSGLIEHVQAITKDSAGAKETYKHIAEGIFTIRDLKENIQNIMKMGPLSKVAGMIPGLGNMMQGMDDEDGTMKLKRMIYIFDSMTAKELDSDGQILIQQPSRMTRIAHGSGTTVREVEELLTQHKMMAKMAKNVGGQKKNMQRAQAMMQGGNKQQQMAAMQKRMAAMGGGAGRGQMPGGMGDMGKMMQMLQGMGGGGSGGMPNLGGMDLNAMMQQMGGMMGGGGAGRGRGRTATLEDVKKRYKQLALQYHPDKNRSDIEIAHKQFIRIAAAYEALSLRLRRQDFEEPVTPPESRPNPFGFEPPRNKRPEPRPSHTSIPHHRHINQQLAINYRALEIIDRQLRRVTRFLQYTAAVQSQEGIWSNLAKLVDRHHYFEEQFWNLEEEFYSSITSPEVISALCRKLQRLTDRLQCLRNGVRTVKKYLMRQGKGGHSNSKWAAQDTADFATILQRMCVEVSESWNDEDAEEAVNADMQVDTNVIHALSLRVNV